LETPPLTVPGPTILTAEAIERYDAVNLFLQRAHAARADFAITDDNAPTVSAICTRLDGLPLAIELAAARVGTMELEELLTGLSHRLDVLTEGYRDLPTRQRTMRDAIAWSYDLLSTDERTLFRRLAVCVGGCMVEAAEKIAGSELRVAEACGSAVTDDRHADGMREARRPTLDLIDSLTDKHLLRIEETDDGPRILMLETIREFGLERLEASGEAAATRQAHAAFALALAEEAHPELAGPEQAKWLDRLDDEVNNLRAALNWTIDRGDAEMGLRLAGALWPFWRIRGHIRDGRAWLERVLALPRASTAPPAVRAQALGGLGNLATNLGHYSEAQTRLEECLALQRELSDPRGIAAALHSLALVAQHQNAYDRSAALFEQSLLLAREQGDDLASVISLNGLAIAAQAQGDIGRATTFYEESLAIARRLGAPRFIAVALGNLGNLAADQGDADRAVMLYEESLARYREVWDRRGVAICLYSLGHQAVTQGDDRAYELLAEALRIFVDLGDPSAVAESLDVLARTIAERGSVLTAARLLRAAASLRERTSVPAPTDPHYRADYDRAVAVVSAALGADQLVAVQTAVREVPLEHIVAEALTPDRWSRLPDEGSEETGQACGD
jgi:predicted ATPase